MRKSTATNTNRPPQQRHPSIGESALYHALRMLLTNGEQKSRTNGFASQTRSRWLGFLRGSNPPPVKPELQQDAEWVGQDLAAFIQNSQRRKRAQQNGGDHELRSALGESVKSLSQLVAECTNSRSDLNAGLSEIHELISSQAENPNLSTAEEIRTTIADLRRIIRVLDEQAKERKRAVNSRLASLRLELLSLPAEKGNLHRTVQSGVQVEEYFATYRRAAQQLGESLTVVSLVARGTVADNIIVTIAEHFRECLKREVDLVVRPTDDRLDAFLIDTPQSAVETLLTRFASTLASDSSLSDHLDTLGLGSVEIDPNAPATAMPEDEDIKLKSIFDFLDA